MEKCAYCDYETDGVVSLEHSEQECLERSKKTMVNLTTCPMCGSSVEVQHRPKPGTRGMRSRDVVEVFSPIDSASERLHSIATILDDPQSEGWGAHQKLDEIRKLVQGTG